MTVSPVTLRDAVICASLSAATSIGSWPTNHRGKGPNDVGAAVENVNENLVVAVAAMILWISGLAVERQRAIAPRPMDEARESQAFVSFRSWPTCDLRRASHESNEPDA